MAARTGSTFQLFIDIVDEARSNLQTVFIAFALTLVLTIWAMRAFVWDFLKEVTESQMDAQLAENVDIIVRTPFDVILLQIKIGLVLGIIVALIGILYYSRSALIERDLLPPLPLSKRRRYAVGVLSLLLGVGGVIYAYEIFFPVMFQFLADNAILSGVKPQYDIVMWTEFLVLLTISFALAAQIPLFMTISSYYEAIKYETFRDKWKYAVLGIFLFGALFSPPDPFTQLMWGVPLVALYFFSLALAKLAANYSRAEAAHDPAVQRRLRRKTLIALGGGVLATAAGIASARVDLLAVIEPYVRPSIPALIRPEAGWTIEAHLAMEGLLGEVVFGLGIGVVAIVVIGIIYAIQVLRRPIPPSHHAMIASDPEDLDLHLLDTEGLQIAPIEAFAVLDEQEAVALAEAALEDKDAERAQLILHRYDEAQEELDAGEVELESADDADESGSMVKERATGIVDAFTEDETTEEDIGGYWHDIVFIYETLTSRMFRILVVFLAVTGGVFYWLYAGGIGRIREDFLQRMPAEVIDPGDLSIIVALHPVEVLLFNVKISLIIAIMVTIPMILYYAWPALGERGFVSGDRRVFFFWGGLMIGGLLFGSWFGYSYIAPPLFSALVLHAVDAGMVISYRLKSFAWLVFFTTMGIGLMFNMLMTMLIFHRGNIVRYSTMRRRWRGVVVWTFIASALFTPGSILSMLLVAVPVVLTYALGLGLLWALTLPSRVIRSESQPNVTE